MRRIWLAACLILPAVPGAAAEPFAAERAFAELLLGRYYADPCANTSGGSSSCPPRFSERQMRFADPKAQQVYRFEKNRCVVHAETETASGERYSATFNLQNVLYVNLNKAQQEGSLKEIELLLQGEKVLQTPERSGNVLVIIHKYFATAEGDIGHEVGQEVLDMRRALKRYQELYCGGMG